MDRYTDVEKERQMEGKVEIILQNVTKIKRERVDSRKWRKCDKERERERERWTEEKWR